MGQNCIPIVFYLIWLTGIPIAIIYMQHCIINESIGVVHRVEFIVPLQFPLIRTSVGELGSFLVRASFGPYSLFQSCIIVFCFIYNGRSFIRPYISYLFINSPGRPACKMLFMWVGSFTEAKLLFTYARTHALYIIVSAFIDNVALCVDLPVLCYLVCAGTRPVGAAGSVFFCIRRLSGRQWKQQWNGIDCSS